MFLSILVRSNRHGKKACSPHHIKEEALKAIIQSDLQKLSNAMNDDSHNNLTGLIYQNKEKKSYEDLVTGFKPEGLAKQNIQLTEAEFDKLVAEFK